MTWGWLAEHAAKGTVGTGKLPGKGGGNCMGVSGGGTVMGPVNEDGKVSGKCCTGPTGPWMVVWKELVCDSCGPPDGKDEDDFAISEISLLIVWLLLGRNGNCPGGGKARELLGLEFASCLSELINWPDGNGCLVICGDCMAIGCFSCCKLMWLWGNREGNWRSECMTSPLGIICGKFPRTKFVNEWFDWGENELGGIPGYLGWK